MGAELAAHFFAECPFGRGWVGADGPYNEHLVRDYDGLNLAMGLVTAAAIYTQRSSMATAALLGWLAFSIPHFVYHMHHLDPFDGLDVAGNAAGTALPALIAAGGLCAVLRHPLRRGTTDPGVGHRHPQAASCRAESDTNWFGAGAGPARTRTGTGRLDGARGCRAYSLNANT